MMRHLNHLKLLCAAAAVSGFAVLTLTAPAHALTAQECSAKYQAAKTAGTLNGQKWNDFRKTQCADAAAATPAAAPKTAATTAPKPAAAAPAAVGKRPVPERDRSEIRQGEAEQGAECTPASISTTPTRRATPMAA